MKRSSLFWGGILILLGALFLLENLDIININFSIWGLFWPLLIIWIGVQTLLKPNWGRRSARDIEHLTLPIKGVESAHIRVNYGAGELHIHGNTAPDELLDGSFGSGVEYDLAERGDGIDLKMRPPSSDFFTGPWWGPGEYRNWSFGLNQEIPISLEVKTGASKAVLNLTDLNLEDLRLQTGASETTVNLPANAGHTQVRAETGVAEVNFHVPPGVAARIRTSGGLHEIKVDQSRFPRMDGRYESADYDTAENKVDIDLTVGLGSAKIR